jgi:S-DNA-T family DNA segregation ATPase FtsK/SpoIIIE
VERITGLAKDLQRSLKAKAIRIFAPIPGEDTVGVEIPNKVRETVSFREIVESAEWQDNATWPRNGAPRIPVPLLFGKNVKGEEEISDLTKMPHLLVAGASGMGKSVGLNAIIGGLLMSRTPEQLRLVLVDPKGGMEFAKYARLPHLLVPVVTEIKGVVAALKWAAKEMARRQAVLAEAGCRDIRDYNVRTKELMPYIVVVIDELADIMTLAGRDVEPVLGRLMALARATGIHLILATQRPDVKVISGTIKANIPGRVAFKTSSSVDSRTILDDTGAENLIGKGDMLFKGKDGLLIRAQGAWISDGEIANITNFIQEHSNTQFDEKFATKLGRVKEASIEDPFASNEDDPDNQPGGGDMPSAKEMVKANEDADLFKRALECIINTNRASVSHFQRRLGIGYNPAAKLCDKLEDAGVIGPQQGAGPRPIIMDQQQLLAIFNGNGEGGAADGEAGGAAAPETEPDGEFANQEEPQ